MDPLEPFLDEMHFRQMPDALLASDHERLRSQYKLLHCELRERDRQLTNLITIILSGVSLETIQDKARRLSAYLEEENGDE